MLSFREEYIAERAAIMEYDAGLPRAEAERRAAEEWKAYVQRLSYRNRVIEWTPYPKP